MEAKKLGKRSGYAPAVGAEHCPACWVLAGASNRLRTEFHHNGDRVSVAVCDSCGLFIAI